MRTRLVVITLVAIVLGTLGTRLMPVLPLLPDATKALVASSVQSSSTRPLAQGTVDSASNFQNVNSLTSLTIDRIAGSDNFLTGGGYVYVVTSGGAAILSYTSATNGATTVLSGCAFVLTFSGDTTGVNGTISTGNGVWQMFKSGSTRRQAMIGWQAHVNNNGDYANATPYTQIASVGVSAGAVGWANYGGAVALTLAQQMVIPVDPTSFYGVSRLKTGAGSITVPPGSWIEVDG